MVLGFDCFGRVDDAPAVPGGLSLNVRLAELDDAGEWEPLEDTLGKISGLANTV